VQIDNERLTKYLDEIISETTDLEALLVRQDREILQDRHMLKSLKYSTIVIAEAIASTLQHILAKRHNIVVETVTWRFLQGAGNSVCCLTN